MAGRNIILNRSTPISPADLKTQAKAAGLALYNIDTGGNIIGFLDSLGNPVAPKIYPLGGQPYPWDIAVGSKVLIDPAALSGLGKTTLPIELINHGDILAPNVEQILYQVQGSYANPAVLLTLASGENGFFASGSLLKIPKEFLYKDLGIRIRAKFFKFGADATSTTFRIRCGNSTLLGSNDNYGQVFPSAANSQVPLDVTIRANTLGATGAGIAVSDGITKLATNSVMNAVGGDYAGDRAANFSTVSDVYVALNASGTVGSQAALVSYIISLVP